MGLIGARSPVPGRAGLHSDWRPRPRWNLAEIRSPSSSPVAPSLRSRFILDLARWPALPIRPPTPASPTLPLAAQDVARGVTRLFFRQDLFALCEVPLPNGRRADMMAIDADGADHHRRDQGVARRPDGRQKWTDYLDYCDRFFWAVPAGFDSRRRSTATASGPDCAGLIVADRYDAAVVREAPLPASSPPARRKAETLALRPPRGAAAGRRSRSGSGRARLERRASSAVAADARALRAASGSAAARAVLASHNRAPNSRRHCRSGWDRRRWLQQQPHHRQVAPLDGEDQRRLAAAVGEVDVGPPGQQLLGALDPADLGGEDQRRVAVIVLESGRAPLPSRKREPGEVAAAHEDVQRALAGARSRVLMTVEPASRQISSTLSPSRSRTRLQEGEAVGKALAPAPAPPAAQDATASRAPGASCASY